MTNEALKIYMENKVRIKTAMSILRDVLPYKEYGVTREELVAVTEPLSILVDKVIMFTDK